MTCLEIHKISIPKKVKLSRLKLVVWWAWHMETTSKRNVNKSEQQKTEQSWSMADEWKRKFRFMPQLGFGFLFFSIIFTGFNFITRSSFIHGYQKLLKSKDILELNGIIPARLLPIWATELQDLHCWDNAWLEQQLACIWWSCDTIDDQILLGKSMNERPIHWY